MSGGFRGRGQYLGAGVDFGAPDFQKKYSMNTLKGRGAIKGEYLHSKGAGRTIFGCFELFRVATPPPTPYPSLENPPARGY